MDNAEVKKLPQISLDLFLMNYDFGKELDSVKTGEVRDFKVRCREFVDRLVYLILDSPCVKSAFCKAVYCFCPEILLEGDDVTVHQIFADLVGLLCYSGYISADEKRVAIEEFLGYVVEKRRYHAASEMPASSITNIMDYLLRDFAFESRHVLLKVFKICCLFVESSQCRYPSVTFDLSGCALSSHIVLQCVRIVQSYVLSRGYTHQSFFSNQTLERSREAIVDSGSFFLRGDFDLWKDFPAVGRNDFVDRHRELFASYLARRKKSSLAFYEDANRCNRRGVESGTGSGSEVGGSIEGGSSSLAQCMKRKKDAAISGQSELQSGIGSSGKSNKKAKPGSAAVMRVVSSPADKSSSKSKDVASSSKTGLQSGGSSSAKSSSRSGRKQKDSDPDVYHKI